MKFDIENRQRKSKIYWIEVICCVVFCHNVVKKDVEQKKKYIRQMAHRVVCTRNALFYGALFALRFQQFVWLKRLEKETKEKARRSR